MLMSFFWWQVLYGTHVIVEAPFVIFLMCYISSYATQIAVLILDNYVEF